MAELSPRGQRILQELEGRQGLSPRAQRIIQELKARPSAAAPIDPNDIGPPTPGQAPSPEPGLLSRVAEEAGDFFRSPDVSAVPSFLKGALQAAPSGAAGAVSGVVDFANQVPRLLNLLPGEQNVPTMTEGLASLFGTGPSAPVLGREAFAGPLEAAVPEPTSGAQRFGQAAGREIGVAALPVAGLLGAASRSAAPVSALGRAFVEPFRRAPAATTAIEAASAAGAGIGMEAAGDITPEGLPAGAAFLSELAGALAGGVAGGSALSRATGIGVDQAARAARAETAKRASEQGLPSSRRSRVSAGKRLIEDSERARGAPEFLRNIQEGEGAASAVEGFDLTTAQATQDPGTKAVEAFRSRGKGGEAFTQRRTAQNQATEDALQEIEPTAITDQPAREALEARRTTAREAQAEGTQRQEGEREAAVQAAEPGQTRQEAGRSIRSEVDEELAVARTEERDAFGRVNPEDKVTVTTDDITGQAQAMLRTAEKDPAKLESLPDIVREIAEGDGINALNPTERLEQVTAVRTNIQNAIREERSKGAPRRQMINALNDLNESIFAALEPGAGKVNDLLAPVELQRANRISRELNDKFTRGQVAKVRRPQATGADAVADSDVVREFFKPGSAKGAPEAIDDFVRAVGNRPEASRALRDGVLAEVQERFVTDGVVNLPGLRKFIKDHRIALDRMPVSVRSELNTVEGAQAAVARQTRREEMVRAGLKNPRQSTIAKYLDREEGADSMADVLKAKQPRAEMTNLVNLVKGDEMGLEGVKRAFWENMRRDIASDEIDLSLTPFLKPKQFKEFLTKHSAAAEALYKGDPGQLRRLRKIADTINLGEGVKPSARIASRQSLAEAAKGAGTLTFAGAQSRIYAVKRGVVSAQYMAVETGVRAGRNIIGKGVAIQRSSFEEMLDRSLLDIEVAKTLALEVSANSSPVIQRRLRLHLADDPAALLDGDEAKKELAKN